MQRKRKRIKLAAEVKSTPKESKVVLKEETGKRARTEALNYLVIWSGKEKNEEGRTEWKFNKTR